MRYIPTRLLRVGYSACDPFLVETGGAAGKVYGNCSDYVALSHCQGHHPFVATTKSTLRARKAGVAWTQLSKTFQDAIILTRDLGVDFVWIDSLCIIQDDAEDWAREASQMASIYRNGYITIAATWAASGQEGFLHGRELPKVYQFPVAFGEQQSRKNVHFLCPKIL